MALNSHAGFSRLANAEANIRNILASIVVEPEPKHRPFVSKKKEAKRKLAEQQQQLEQLQATTLDQIVFSFDVPPPLTKAAQEQAELDAFEEQLRRDWGLVDAAPEPVQPVQIAKVPRAKKPVQAAPVVVPQKPKPHLNLVKRQIEVVLQVARADGSEVPFYHCDTGMSEFEAELAAGRKARSYGLRVLHTINITRKEYAREI